MSYSLTVQDGDLIQSGSSLVITYGVNKLKQDLSLWLTERYGIDRFHPSMGSTLQEYIGGIIDGNVEAEIQSEVLRILQNYQNVQLRGMKENPQLYSLSELLYAIDDVQVMVNFDAVFVSIKIRNADLDPATITVSQTV